VYLDWAYSETRGLSSMHDIIEGKMVGRATCGRSRIDLLRYCGKWNVCAAERECSR